ncbi:MAG TPA: AAA family ATPase [Gammaproteobacteria bacterium]|nr:AAA family ATPase [Gammaproteobacteria bacterium]
MHHYLNLNVQWLSYVTRKQSLEKTLLRTFTQLKETLNQQILGQEALVERLLIALLANGHLLVEGAPGLAKTRAINELSNFVQGDFQRIQFTPDLLPADLTGTEIYRPEDASFRFQPGPLFHNLILADEINRAPAKVQSALLEAMAERHISIGHKTYPLDDLFLVMATQNPIEQEGTYPLPEAQLDRFLMHVKVNYPAPDVEKHILQLVRKEAKSAQYADKQTKSDTPIVSMEQIMLARREVLSLYMVESVEDYLVRLISSSRDPGMHLGRDGEQLSRWVAYGASPRGTLALDSCARAHAWLAGRDYVSPEDIQAIAPDVLRHRILLSFEAEAEGITTDELISQLLQLVASP